MSPLLALFLLQPQSPAQAFFNDLKDAVGSGSEPRVRALFAKPSDGDYLFRMARNTVGLRKLRVNLLPTPPGWGKAPYWAVIHTFQDLESDHDPVYEVTQTDAGLRLGREVPEFEAGHNRITHADIKARLTPEAHRVEVQVKLKLTGSALPKATVMRLNDAYGEISAETMPVVVAGDNEIPSPKSGDLLRVGSLLIPWTTTNPKQLSLKYQAILDRENMDQINDERAYVTSWWIPSTARLPLTTHTEIEGPSDWVLRSEGVEERPNVYLCDLPISYPKVIGGRYKLVASRTDRGRLFRAYQLEPINEEAGKQSVDLAANAVAFFEDKLGTFPFPGYDVLDGKGYYGIESYSYTLLDKSIVNRYTSHEIGHTYFGGMAPSPYVRDSWNEGVTQYVDSVLYLGNYDKTLEAGSRSLRVKTPISAMPAAHDWDGQSYWRGAYVMRMLENQIGLDAVWSALRGIVKNQRGKDTYWAVIRPYFEDASGQKLDWFWRQWIDADTFPSLKLVSATSEKWNGKDSVRVTVSQSGTPYLYRMKFKVVATNGGQRSEQVVDMSSPVATFNVPTNFRPTEVRLDPFGYSLASVSDPIRL